MTKQFVQVLADVNCEWEGLAPTYRLYVDDELFAERTWRWTDSYLEEIIQIYRNQDYPEQIRVTVMVLVMRFFDRILSCFGCYINCDCS